MKIIRDFESPVYDEKNRALGNCFTLIDGNTKYFFEFNVKGMEAEFKCDRISVINDVIDEFRKYSGYVNVFYNKDRSFYKAFDEVQTFKLPISVIQPSKFFINEERLEIISSILENKEVYIPVAIINEEYVALDGHTRIMAKINEDCKMVNVYMSPFVTQATDDMVYMAKENNIHNVKSMPILKASEYNKIMAELEAQFNY